jgi:autotransporter-associated beta strand protein
LLCGFVALAPVRAQFSWSPTAASSVFEADANWSLGVAPTAGANLFFSSSAVSDLVLAANFNARSLAFNGSYPAYTFSTGSAATLGVGSGGLAVGSGGGVTFTPGLGVVLIASQTWNLAGNLTVAGTVSGSGSSLTKSGAGTLTLTGTSTYSGTTTINGGTLQIGAGGTTGNLGASSVTNHATLRFDRTNTHTVANAIGGSGNLEQAGTGTTVLTGANTYSGATTVSAGTLQIGAGGTTGNLGAGSVTNNATLRLDRSNTHTVANAIGGSGNLVQAGTGTTVLTGANTYSGDTSINAGTLKLGAAGVLPTGVGKGDVTVNSAGTLDLNGLSHTINGLSGGGTVTSGAGGALTFGVGSDGSGSTFSGSIQDGSGTLSLLKAGNGIINLSGTNTYSGTTTINGGTLQIGAGGTSGSIGSGNITNNANLRFNRSNTLTVASAIGGSGNLVQAGTGTTVLTAASSYSGTTTVTAGTLRVGVANALPTTTSLSLASGTLLDVDFNQTVAGFFGASGAGAAIDVAGGTIFSVALPTAATATSFAGAVNGVGTFAVSGPGDNTVTLNGAVAGTVATTVGSGTTLVIGTGGSLSGSVVISGMLTFTIPGNQTLSGVLSGTGGLTVSAGAVTLGANNTFSGPATVTGGQLLVAGTNTGGGSVTVGAGGIFGGAGSFNGPLVVNSGGALAPGASPGVLNVGPTTFAGGAAFNFEINNSAGTAGSEWDLLSISGALTITATAINPFVINLASLTLSNTPGLLTGFNPNNSYSWRFVQTTDAIAGFSSGAFQSNAGAFQNSLNGGSFFVSNVGSDLYLNFTPVPEPSTYALLALGLGAYAFLARRRGIRSGVRQEPER